VTPTITATPVVSSKVYGNATEELAFVPTGVTQTASFNLRRTMTGPDSLVNVYLIDTVSGAVYSVGNTQITMGLQVDAGAFALVPKAFAYPSTSTQVSIFLPSGLLTGGNLHRVVVTYLTKN